MSDRPNLLLIFSDQHSRHMLGCYGNEAAITPNLDALAGNGTRFENSYSSCPVCVPARASMAIGDYASRFGYYDNAFGYDGKVGSWGTCLTESGYEVTTIGKLHFKSDTPDTGFPDQRIPLHIKDGVGDIYGAIRDKEISRPQFRKALEDAHFGESDYTRFDREVSRRAEEFLEEHSHDAEPFALMLGYVSPHFPLIAPEEFEKLYPDPMKLPLPVQFDPDQWPHHPVLDDYRRYCCQTDLPDSVKRNAIRVYYALCSFLDSQIGIVMDVLKRTGLDRNTVVIYCSDHGDTMGEHGFFFKSTMYEGSVGIPMIMCGPGIGKGNVVKTPVSLVDIYPTVLDCFGLKEKYSDQDKPGKSLLEIASAPYDDERAVYSEYMAFGMYTSEFMIRKGDFKYVHYVGERPQLFNLASDPDECGDISSDEEYSGILSDLEKELRAVVDPETVDKDARKAQEELLDSYGGKDEFLRTFHPALFSPIPDLAK